MKKRLIMASLITIATIALCACGNKSESSSDKKQQNEVNAFVENDETSTPIPTKEDNIAVMEEYLLNKGVISGERTEMAAVLIGGLSGFKYDTPKAEVYEFDINSEAYKRLLETKKIEIGELEPVNLIFNGKYILFSVDENVINAFMEYGK